VEAHQTGQDYSGILMGEVSGDWTAPTSFAPLAPEAPGATVTVTLPNPKLAPKNQPVTVPVTTSDLSFATTGVDVISYQFVLTYDPAILIPQNPAVTVAGTLSENGAVTINQLTPGILNVVVFRANPMVGAGTLFNFQFTISPSANPGTMPPLITPLTWQSFQFNEGNPADATSDGSVHVLGPTAANVGIGGRLLTAYGQPVSNTRVTITDMNGESRSTLSSSLGYYRFEDVEVGQTYLVSVKTRRFRFQPMTISVTDELTELDLIAEPE
jgi:hypothetical protein